MQMNLPAHLQGRVASGAVARATEGMGSTLPPHISIQGNKFTFIDASGNEAPPMLSFDGYIVDVSDHINKRYYDKPFDQKATTYEPPACWSANGYAPSREAPKPQSVTCEACPHNVRGSATSAISGAAIKACRDERWLAVVNPQFGEMLFQLVISPGSFSNFKAFCKTIENYQVDFPWMLVRFQFEDKTNGVLNFTPVNWTAPEHIAVIDKMLAERKQDAIVGRLDQPRTGALPAPGMQQGIAQGTAAQLPPNQFAPPQGPASNQMPMQQPQQGFVQQPVQEVIPPGQQAQTPFGGAPSGPATVNAAPAATGFGATPGAGGNAGFASPSSGLGSMAPNGAVNPGAVNQAAPQAQPTQRRRRNAAAAPAPTQAAPQAQQGGFQQPQGGFQPSAPPAGGPVPQAPFGAPNAGSQAPQTMGAPSAGQAPAGNNFGIGGGVQVNPEMSAMLGSIFGQNAPQ